MDPIGKIVIEWYYGVRDSIQFVAVIETILRSSTIRTKFQRTFVFNGVIWLGLFFVLWITRKLFFGDSKSGAWYAALYHVFILIPIYMVSFILNTFWYGDIAVEGMQIEIRKGNKNILPPTSDVATRLYNEVINGVLVGFFFLQAFLVSLIPVVGEPLRLFHMCFIYAFTAFAYKWGTEAQNFKRIIAFFEDHFAYYCGFGFFFTCMTMIAPGLMSSGVYSLLFPVFELLAIKGTPPTLTQRITNFSQIAEAMRDYEKHSIYQDKPSEGKVTQLAYIRNYQYNPERESGFGVFTFAKFGIELTGDLLRRYYKL